MALVCLVVKQTPILNIYISGEKKMGGYKKSKERNAILLNEIKNRLNKIWKKHFKNV